MLLTTSQLAFDLLSPTSPKSGRGGKRAGAGRKKGRTVVGHLARPKFPARNPVHVTLRMLPGIRLRSRWLMATIRSAIMDSQSESFRIVHYSVQYNHVHLIIETEGRDSLSSGVTGLVTRLAQRLNGKLRRTGPLFEERYHSRDLETPTEVRYAIRYVLLNARHHAEERGESLPSNWLDPFTSAASFDGWAEPITQEETFTWAEEDLHCVTVAPQTWLLREGWKKAGGLLRFDEVPGAKRRSRKRLARVAQIQT